MIATEPLPATCPPGIYPSSIEHPPSAQDTSFSKAIDSGDILNEGVKGQVAMEIAVATEVDVADCPDGGLKAWLVVVGVCSTSSGDDTRSHFCYAGRLWYVCDDRPRQRLGSKYNPPLVARLK